MNKETIQNIINQHPEFKDKLFCRGFLLTDAAVDEKTYPFYDGWNKQNVGDYKLFVSPKQHYYVYNSNGVSYALVGHAYNPVSGEADENSILKELSNKLNFGLRNTSYLNQLTGVFTLLCAFGGVN